MGEETTSFKVKADLVLDATRARAQTVQMQAKIFGLANQIRGTSNLAAGMVRNLVGIGAAYFGVAAITRAFAAAKQGATEYAKELESTRIGLTSVMAAVTGAQWSQAEQMAGNVFEQVRQDSIKSVATAQELFTLYQGIVGPIIQAGFGLKTVRTMTLDTVNAAGVLGVDLEQARRDVSLMVRGAAGMDVKLFSMLRSTGAIVESTEQWNKSLTQQERVEKLAAALARFAPAGDKFARSFAGVTSTFKGIRQEFTRSAWQPIMDSMARALWRVNDILIANQDTIQDRLRQWGEKTAKCLDGVFERAANGLDYVISHWDEIMGRANAFASTVSSVGHRAAVGGAAYAGVQMARPLLAAGVTGIGKLAGWMGPAAAMEGAAAAGATGAAGAAGGAGAAAAAGGGFAALGPALVIAASAAASLGGAIGVVREQWANFQSMFDMFSPIVSGLGDDLMGLGKALIETLAPIFKTIANIAGAWLVPTFTAFVGVLRIVVRFAKVFVENIGSMLNGLYGAMRPAFDALWGMVNDLVHFIAESVTWITKDIQRSHALVRPIDHGDAIEELRKRFGGPYKDPLDPSNFQVGTPNKRTTVVNDFRGSKIEVKQSFRDADPDRVLLQMVRGIHREAELKIQSGMVPAFGR